MSAKTRTMGIVMDPDLYDAVVARAKADDRSMAAVCRVALRAYLASDGQREGEAG